jgi:hypothetical protein
MNKNRSKMVRGAGIAQSVWCEFRGFHGGDVNPENARSMDLRYVGILPQHYTASQPNSQYS